MTPDTGAAARKAPADKTPAEKKSESREADTSEGIVSTRHGIVVLDFGGQYTQLIARRVREQQVFSAILPCTASMEEIRALEPVGLVLSGGPSSVYDAEAPVCDPKVLQLGVPVLGICYGMQWLTHTLGGKVERGDCARVWPGAARYREAGFNTIQRACRAAENLEQPRRSRGGITGRISRDGPHGQRGGGDRGCITALLRCGISSRGKSHRSRHATSCRISCFRFAAQRRIGTAPDLSPPRWTRFAGRRRARGRSAR